MSTVVHCRRRTHVAVAVCFDGAAAELFDMLAEGERVEVTGDGSGRVVITRPDGATRMLAPGDHLVRDHKGGLTVVPPETFEADWEVVRP